MKGGRLRKKATGSGRLRLLRSALALGLFLGLYFLTSQGNTPSPAQDFCADRTCQLNGKTLDCGPDLREEEGTQQGNCLAVIPVTHMGDDGIVRQCSEIRFYACNGQAQAATGCPMTGCPMGGK